MRNKTQKIVVVGASGRTGSLVIKELLKRGYSNIVAVIHKKPLKLPETQKVTQITANATSEQMQDIIKDADVVINTIGTRNIFRPNSFASSKAIYPYLSKDSLYLTLSALGVGSSNKSLSFSARFILNTGLRAVIQDKRKMEDFITSQENAASYIIIRCGGLLQGNSTLGVPLVREAPSKLTGVIHRHYIARIIVDLIESPDTYNKIWETAELE